MGSRADLRGTSVRPTTYFPATTQLPIVQATRDEEPVTQDRACTPEAPAMVYQRSGGSFTWMVAGGDLPGQALYVLLGSRGHSSGHYWMPRYLIWARFSG